MATTIVCDEKVADVSLKGKAMAHAVDHCAGLLRALSVARVLFCKPVRPQWMSGASTAEQPPRGCSSAQGAFAAMNEHALSHPNERVYGTLTHHAYLGSTPSRLTMGATSNSASTMP